MNGWLVVLIISGVLGVAGVNWLVQFNERAS